MDTKTILLFGIIVLIALFPNHIKLPRELKSILNDYLTKIVLVAFAILVSYYDLEVGILLGVLVAILIIKFNGKSLTEGFDSIYDEDFEDDIDTPDDMDTPKKDDDEASITITSPPYKEDKCAEGQKIKTMINPETSEEQEVCVPITNENNKKDKNVSDEKPMLDDDETPMLDEDIDNQELPSEIESFVGSRVKEHFGCGCSGGNNSKKFIETFVNTPKDSEVPLAKNSYCLDKWGYDQAGCRYDMKSDPSNDYPYGKPVANCDTYNGNQVNTTGTLFYPLNN
jgi:hypothetical protein